MTEEFVAVTVEAVSISDSQPSTVFAEFRFPNSLVNPRIALQIATLLTSDPTVPVSQKTEPNVQG